MARERKVHTVWGAGAALAATLAGASLLAAPPPEALRRALPEGPEAAASARRLEELGRAYALTAVRAEAGAPAETSREPHVPVTLTADGRYADVEPFLARFRSGGKADPRKPAAPAWDRVTSLERVTLSPLAPEVVRLTATLWLHFDPASEPRALESHIRAVRDRESDPLQALVLMARDLPPTYAVTEFVAEGPEIHVRGFKLLPGPAFLMERALAWAGVEVTAFAAERREACDRYEVAGRLTEIRPGVSRPYGAPRPAELFKADDAVCGLEAEPPEPVVVRTPPGRAAGGPLSLKLRDVELVDVFRTLHRLAGQDFVVDAGVVQRVSLDLDGVTVAEALDTLGTAGIQVSPLGRLRRVSLAGEAARSAPLAEGKGHPLPFDGERVDVGDLLLLVHDITDLEIVKPSGDLGSVSLFAAELPWDELLSAALLPVGLRFRVEGDRRIVVTREPGAPEPGRVMPSVHPLTKRIRPEPAPNPGKVAEPGPPSVYDVELIGLVRYESQWNALAASPEGTTSRLMPGRPFLEGVVEAVDAEGFTVKMEQGQRLRVTLPPLD